ncbi:hypothetical protein [Lysinibacillus sp. NPDC047702]|uniref:hypothetical protein n=1 Tax=unclassified Lysinibacillus TaxID=2636778 RepID=UPI003D08B2C6
MNILKKWFGGVFVFAMLFSIQHQVADAADYRTVKVVSGSSLLVREEPNDAATT